MSRLRSTALAAWSWHWQHGVIPVSGDMICHHSPDEACQFSCNCGFGYICFFWVAKNHPIIAASQAFVSFICICNHLRCISFLPCSEGFGFVSDLPPWIALSCFCKQTTNMAISGFGDTKSILIFGAGIFTGNNSQIRCKVLCICKTLEVTNLNNYR